MGLVEMVRRLVVEDFRRARSGTPGDAALDDVCELAQMVLDRIDAGEPMTPAMEKVLHTVVDLHRFHNDFPDSVLMSSPWPTGMLQRWRGPHSP